METDASLVGPPEAPIKLVWGHGLGSKDPELRTRFNDGASNVTFSAMEAAGARLVCYDARGHGASHGWEAEAERDRDQFSWPHLARDMARLASQYGLDSMVVGGSSMGSATAGKCRCSASSTPRPWRPQVVATVPSTHANR